jgi:hypothetical protein
MTSSFPHTPESSCPSSSFGAIDNKPKYCNNILYKLVKKPRVIVNSQKVYNPHPIATGTIGTEFPTADCTLYWYMNPVDVLGEKTAVTINRIRLQVLSTDTSGFTAAIYKLTPGATIGDFTTYENNSTKLVESGTLLLNDQTFFDLVFPIDITISALDSFGNPNHYFIALSHGGMTPPIIGASSIPPFTGADAQIYNYAYFDDNSPSIPPATMGPPLVPATQGQAGVYLYYTLWKFS